ncbi:hypothetical protein HJ030_21105 [Vibrio parahaemolyticus]|uniref:hypothetical protein n=1 Tax=Vibrio parahaemolyticus TaxID=670 RepID=UPI001869B956|nr:hypothetical protein [Vibrio parahaemolyticus]EHR6713958.1 hypothetical protein [Vibrio parahaemolyticus]MBE4385635.1 hypothetical protein [Vibrio parahaemolyticus]HCE1969745.1 hypothetical protein [Vibrio parahaemolyticus]HCG8413937.1 hypothetical protein [Vibrio parahaemolyticus]
MDKNCSCEKKSDTLVRLEAMLAAFHAGQFTAPNRDPKKGTPKHDYKNMPEDTIYASL